MSLAAPYSPAVTKYHPHVVLGRPLQTPYTVKVLSPRTVRVARADKRRSDHVITVPADIASVGCYPVSIDSRHTRAAVWLTLKDRRRLIFSAWSGKLLHDIPDSLADPRVQAEIKKLLERWNSPIRYAVVHGISRTSNSFYNFSSGDWESSHLPDAVLFKDREIAKAAAAILTKQRRERGKTSVILPGRSRPLQTVAVRRTLRGWKFLEKIKTKHAAYIPAFVRFTGRPTEETPSLIK